MSVRRLGLVLLLDLRGIWRRPLLWILVLLLGFLSWGLSSGHARIQSGDATVGGTKSLITSQFAVGMTLSLVVGLCYSFFVTIAAGMAVIRDDELKTGEILHATPLRPSEYIWGKHLAVIVSFLGVLGLHLLLMIFFNHVVPHPGAEKVHGSFSPINYILPAVVFGLPIVLFLAGCSFFLGERTRRPVLVFLLPTALLLLCAFFLWDWSPSWLDPRINRALMLIDPAGFRWLHETWIKVDRGVDFYNTASIPFDASFLASRLAFCLGGFFFVLWTQKGFESRLRGATGRRARHQKSARARSDTIERVQDRSAILSTMIAEAMVTEHRPWRLWRWRPRRGGAAARAAGRDAESSEVAAPAPSRPLASLGMRSGAPGLIRGILEIARVEARELRSQPGLYLFVPVILLETLGSNLVQVGAFDTPVLLTSGTLAVRMMNTLTLLVCLLMLFYTVESLQRERTTGLASIAYAAPVRTVSIVFGKTLANSVVAVVILLATFIGCALALLVQGKVRLELGPFLLVWGLLLLPTFLVWSAFVTAALAVTRNRYTTYGIALGVLTLTGYLQFRGKMNWVWNWDLWSTLLWSDMGLLEIDRWAIVLNRSMVLGLTVFFVALAVRLFPRLELDGGRVLHRLSPPRLLGAALRVSPFAVVPLLAGALLWIQVHGGFQGKTLEKRQKDYWKQNLATWKDAPLPQLEAVDLDLALEPSRRWFRTKGTYELINRKDSPLGRIPLTGGPHWEKVKWTIGGKEAKPDNRTDLYVFTPEPSLAPGERLRIGFEYEGRLPWGITKNGGGSAEFILPSGVVLTSFVPTFVPVLGYLEEIGVKADENQYETRLYADDFYKGVNEPMLSTGSAFTTRIRITGPAEYTLNSVGSLTSEKVEGGRRTVVWESDSPVKFFNVVAGRWDVKRAGRTAIYYDRGHPYNIEEMSEALVAAVRYYSEWFHPFPWKELKISEFPALAFYAQGFPTNITFSEGIGFLTRSDPKTQTAFIVTAHEAAHQWWGSILTPGKGPGGDILSEGMSHFSTILLLGQLKGERERIELCKRFEERYGNDRQADSERPLVKIDGSRPGDRTVTYDKGGWVFWMLLNQMGRDAAFAGLKEFIATYGEGPDYPLLEDFVETMRRHASDPAAYDEFTKQWFFQVVVPEYRLSDATRARVSSTSAAAPGRSDGPGKDPSSARPAALMVERLRQDRETAPAVSSAAHSGRTLSGKGSDSELDETWEATVWVTNAGKGKIPVEIAAVRGERFDPDGKGSDDYRDSRSAVVLDAGETREVRIRCAFQPERIVVDPDAKVLQLGRKSATVSF